jgi:ADP-ribose pyrophosphatase
VLYFVVGALGFWLESRAGNRFEQGWQFYAITFSLFIVFAFPASRFSISSNDADGCGRRVLISRSPPMAELPNHDAALTETCLDSEAIFDGAFLKLKRDTVRLPDGKQATREYVQHPGAVMVIPLFDDGRVLMESQYRYPIGKVMAEFPAGKLDPNEGALACAVRELREETGYTAREYVFLTRIHPIISYSTEFIDLYLARGLTAGERKLDEGEFLETFTATLPDLLEWVRTGQISDVKTIIGTMWLEKVLSGNWPLGALQNPERASAASRHGVTIA